MPVTKEQIETIMQCEWNLWLEFLEELTNGDYNKDEILKTFREKTPESNAGSLLENLFLAFRAGLAKGIVITYLAAGLDQEKKQEETEQKQPEPVKRTKPQPVPVEERDAVAERRLNLMRKICNKYFPDDIISETDVKASFKYGLYKGNLETITNDIDALIYKGFLIEVKKEFAVKRNRGRFFRVPQAVYKMSRR